MATTKTQRHPWHDLPLAHTRQAQRIQRMDQIRSGVHRQLVYLAGYQTPFRLCLVYDFRKELLGN